MGSNMWNEEITILNKYVKICRLGNGQFGTVYKAWSIKKNEHVAVKIGSVESLRHESTILHYLRSIHGIPEVLWFGTVSKIGTCLVLTYYEGSVLEKDMNTREKAEWWNDMVGLIQSIHLQEIIHRDLKPSHFLFRNKKWVLIDFGLATVLEKEKKRTDSIVGSPFYASYFVHDGWANNAADDYLSLVYVFWEVILGNFPCVHRPYDLSTSLHPPEHIDAPLNQWTKKLKEPTFLQLFLAELEPTLFVQWLKILLENKYQKLTIP